MPELLYPETSNFVFIAPSVFIESVELYKNKIKVFFSITDPNNFWFNDIYVLEKFNVIFKLNDEQTISLSLSGLRNSSKQQNKIYHFVEFNSSSNNLVISAYCESKTITGEKTTEVIKQNGIISKASVDGQNLTFLSKIKNLDLLDIIPLPQDLSIQKTPKPVYDLFISYAVNKVAKAGFIFDLQNFLNYYSNAFNSIKNANLKQIILSNSSIDIGKTFVSLKNVSLSNKDYIKNNSNLNIIQLTNTEFFITFDFEPPNKNIRDKYQAKIDFCVNDYSYKFIKKELKNNLDNAKSFIKNYKSTLEEHSKNSLINNVNEYFFVNAYDDKFVDILNKIIDSLAYVCSNLLFNKVQEDDYASLFVSLLHPLTTSIPLQEKIINFIDNLLSSLNLIFEEPTQELNQQNLDNLPSTAEAIYEFKNSIIDFDFDENYGYEVINLNSFTARKNSLQTGLYVINSSEFELRKLSEARKYVLEPTQNIRNQLNSYAISFLDLGSTHYDYLYNTQNLESNFKNAFVRVNEYNDFDFSYKNPESFFYQLADKNVFVKTIANARNESVNNLRKTVLFDPNLDSSQKSLKFLTDTGLEQLYYLLDTTKVVNIQSNTFHKEFTSDTVPEAGAKYSFDANNSTIETKARDIFLFNSIFTLETVVSQSNYEIYRVANSTVSEIFIKKLKHFNEYFLVKKQDVGSLTLSFNDKTYNLINELNFAYTPSFYNRSTQQASLLVSTEML